MNCSSSSGTSSTGLHSGGSCDSTTIESSPQALTAENGRCST